MKKAHFFSGNKHTLIHLTQRHAFKGSPGYFESYKSTYMTSLDHRRSEKFGSKEMFKKKKKTGKHCA